MAFECELLRDFGSTESLSDPDDEAPTNPLMPSLIPLSPRTAMFRGDEEAPVKATLIPPPLEAFGAQRTKWLRS
jgi:hypothetical protein